MDPEGRRFTRDRRVVECAPVADGLVATKGRDFRQLVRLCAGVRGIGVQKFPKPSFECGQRGLMAGAGRQVRRFLRIVVEVEELRGFVYVMYVLPGPISEHVCGISGADGVVFAENCPVLVGVLSDLPQRAAGKALTFGCGAGAFQNGWKTVHQ